MSISDLRPAVNCTCALVTGSLGLFTSAVNASIAFTTLTIPAGPFNYNTNLYSLHVDSTGIYAGSEGALNMSTDGGGSWNYYNPANLGGYADWGFSVQQTGGTIYLTQTYGVYISSNGGASWTNIASRDINTGFGEITAYLDSYTSNGTIYVAGYGGQGGVTISTDGGATWQRSSTANGLGSNAVWRVFESGGTVYAGTTNGLSMSTDGGANWSNVTSGLASVSVTDIDVVGNTIYAATAGGLSISTDGGLTWTSYNATDGLGSNLVRSVDVIEGVIYASTEAGLSISYDDGFNWTNYTTSDGLNHNNVHEVAVFGGKLYVATSGGLSVASLSAVPGSGVLALGVIGLLSQFRQRRR